MSLLTYISSLPGKCLYAKHQKWLIFVNLIHNGKKISTYFVFVLTAIARADC